MRILIATHRPADFTAFIAALNKNGVETTLAPTGQAALEQAKNQPPALMVVDDTLPDIGPFALVTRLMEADAAILTAVVSGLPPEELHDAGEGLGILLALPRHPDAAKAGELLAALLPLIPQPATGR